MEVKINKEIRNYTESMFFGLYYPFGRIPTGFGNDAIVQIALSQVGNVGGQPYWSWYGFSGRVEWCSLHNT